MKIIQLEKHLSKDGFVGCEIKTCRSEASYGFMGDKTSYYFCEKHSVFFGEGKVIMSD